MIGNLEIRLPTPVIVTLNPNEIEELMVVRKPYRGMKDSELSDHEKEMGINAGLAMLKKRNNI